MCITFLTHIDLVFHSHHLLLSPVPSLLPLPLWQLAGLFLCCSFYPALLPLLPSFLPFYLLCSLLHGTNSFLFSLPFCLGCIFQYILNCCFLLAHLSNSEQLGGSTCGCISRSFSSHSEICGGCGGTCFQLDRGSVSVFKVIIIILSDNFHWASISVCNTDRCSIVHANSTPELLKLRCRCIPFNRSRCRQVDNNSLCSVRCLFTRVLMTVASLGRAAGHQVLWVLHQDMMIWGGWDYCLLNMFWHGNRSCREINANSRNFHKFIFPCLHSTCPPQPATFVLLPFTMTPLAMAKTSTAIFQHVFIYSPDLWSYLTHALRKTWVHSTTWLDDNTHFLSYST